MFKRRFLGRTHVPHNKNTKDKEAIRFCPESILLSTVQHIGAPATVCVAVGDEVKVGDKIAEAGGFVSSPIYSGISGKVAKIEDLLRPDGKKVPAVRIESDGLMTKKETTPPVINSLDDLIEAVRVSGVVGLGGAGFPTAVKLAAAKSGNIHTLILNGAECEPYITSDTRTMLESADKIRAGIDTIIRHVNSIKKIIIGIEDNKPECIEKMAETFADLGNAEVKALPSLYPQGAEKILIHNTTGVIVEEGKLPADHGILVMNVTSVAELQKFFETGMPLVERTVTVDGSSVDEPKNITTPIGTPIGDLLSFAGVDSDKIGKVLWGGPMMGVSICSLAEPVLKTTNAITVLTEADARYIKHTACIHCGRCVSACPMGLNPTVFARSLKVNDKDERVRRLEEAKVLLCMECGCCSFVCPARRPLVQNNRLAKGEVKGHTAHLASLKK